jgi:hypothetical protein
MAFANLKLEKDNVITGYRRLSDKHNELGERATREKAETTDAYAAELAEFRDELAKETQGYTDYHLNVRHCLRDLHERLDASFGEVKAWCLPFPTLECSDRGFDILGCRESESGTGDYVATERQLHHASYRRCAEHASWHRLSIVAQASRISRAKQRLRH